MKVVAELKGQRAAFSTDGTKLAYLRIPESSSIAQAAAAVESAPADQRAQRVTALNGVVALESRLVVRDLASGTETEMDTNGFRVTALGFVPTGVIFAGTPGEGAGQIYAASDAAPPVAPRLRQMARQDHRHDQHPRGHSADLHGGARRGAVGAVETAVAAMAGLALAALRDRDRGGHPRRRTRPDGGAVMRPSRATVRPRTIVRTTRACSSRPTNGLS